MGSLTGSARKVSPPTPTYMTDDQKCKCFYSSPRLSNASEKSSVETTLIVSSFISFKSSKQQTFTSNWISTSSVQIQHLQCCYSFHWPSGPLRLGTRRSITW